jgi:hypothetical protein
MARHKTPLIDRLQEQSDTSGECWLWNGSMLNSGYGTIGKGGRGGGKITVHRAAWVLASREPIPDGLFVLHTCDVKRCWRNDEPGTYTVRGVVRPRFGHLWLGTQADNSQDKAEKGRAPAGDMNPARLHPERMPRADRHWTRRRPEWVRRGAAHHNTVLTEATVREARQRWVFRKVTVKMLAEEYGVSDKALADALRRITWRHVK